MNLRKIANLATSTINRNIPAVLARNIGFIINADYSRSPTFEYFTAQIQVQAVTEDMLAFMQNQGIQGVLRSVYLDGNWSGIIRADSKGGDILKFNGYDWMVVHVIESWPDWSHVIVAQQNMSVTASINDLPSLLLSSPDV